MSTDARGHRKIDSTEDPSRALFNNVTNAINDWIFVANNTARLALPAQLTSLGTAATAARPVYVRQQDDNTKWQYDGTTWIPLFGTLLETYTPTFTTQAGTPSVGNGTLAGRYIRVGRLHHVEIEFITGSSTNMGQGPIQFSLPSTPAYTTWGTAFLALAGYSYFQGIVRISPGVALADVWTSQAASTSALLIAQNTEASSTSTGTGIPNRPGSYSFPATSVFQLNVSYIV
jgi:hypothetical protein